MAWLSNDHRPSEADPASHPAESIAPPTADDLARPAPRETTPRGFGLKLAVVLGLAAITPGFHLRSLAPLCAAAAVLSAYGAACARERLDASCFNAWDEATVFMSIAWLSFRIF